MCDQNSWAYLFSRLESEGDRKMEAEEVPMMSSNMVDWPCFQQGEFVS